MSDFSLKLFVHGPTLPMVIISVPFFTGVVFAQWWIPKNKNEWRSNQKKILFETGFALLQGIIWFLFITYLSILDVLDISLSNSFYVVFFLISCVFSLIYIFYLLIYFPNHTD